MRCAEIRAEEARAQEPHTSSTALALHSMLRLSQPGAYLRASDSADHMPPPLSPLPSARARVLFPDSALITAICNLQSLGF